MGPLDPSADSGTTSSPGKTREHKSFMEKMVGEAKALLGRRSTESKRSGKKGEKAEKGVKDASSRSSSQVEAESQGTMGNVSSEVNA